VVQCVFSDPAPVFSRRDPRPPARAKNRIAIVSAYYTNWRAIVEILFSFD
jgi:hypothetical protein